MSLGTHSKFDIGEMIGGGGGMGYFSNIYCRYDLHQLSKSSDYNNKLYNIYKYILYQKYLIFLFLYS
jgi:hypothetical protein